MAKGKKRWLDTAITWAIGIASMAALLYPLASNLYVVVENEYLSQRYREEVAKTSEADLALTKSYVDAYNEAIRSGADAQALHIAEFEGGRVVEQPDTQWVRANLKPDISPYDEEPIIGVLEIPKLGLETPIRKGTSANTLSDSVGIVDGTSIPSEKLGVHSVIAGHRGMPGAVLFRHLDLLEPGDQFFIQVGDLRLAYTVRELRVLSPDEAADFSVDAEHNYATLLTCTPYMVNSHRLLVTGELTDVGKPAPVSLPYWFWPALWLALAVLAIAYMLWMVFRRGTVRFYSKPRWDAKPVPKTEWDVYAYNHKAFNPQTATRDELTQTAAGKNKRVNKEALTPDAHGRVKLGRLRRGRYYVVQTAAGPAQPLDLAPHCFRVRAFRAHPWRQLRAAQRVCLGNEPKKLPRPPGINR
ncbi:MAG: class C sortase [Propionibacteriaceae bacterium]|nr:class C sortase [Propionibacteriaceae bacterium]